MIFLNFSHPLSQPQKQAVETLAGKPISDYREIPVQFDHDRSFIQQVIELVQTIELSSEDWQSQPILINPPSHALIAVTLFAELHGRMGYFPDVVRLRPIPDQIPIEYEVAEIVSLQKVREESRRRR